MNPNVAVIEIAGQPLTFRFGISFWSSIMRHFGESDLTKVLDRLKAAIKEDPFTIVPLMMLTSHNIALARDKQPEVDLDYMVDLIDEDGGIASNAIGAYLSAWSASMNRDVPQEGKPKPATAKKTKAKATA